MKVGIIGQGFVGTAIREKFRKTFEVLAYDKQWESAKSFKNDKELTFSVAYNHPLEPVITLSDVIFVCVPTPMYEDGECDISIVESVLSELNALGFVGHIIVKSTIPPGTTEKFNKLYTNLKKGVSFSPEFLTEANAIQDFENQNRIIIGNDNLDTSLAEDLFLPVFGGAEIITTKSKEAEMVKYTTNCFLATKVSFFNDIYRFCQANDISYETVRHFTLLDERIGESHTQVPGPDGDFGYGGHCFPKDMNALVFAAQKRGLKMSTIEGAQYTNYQVRTDKDWEKMKGRAVSKKEKA